MASRMMFVNLPVSDLDRSKAFFGKLGFSFNPRFTDEKAACMVVSDVGYVMLIHERFYRTFTKRELCDTTRQNEGLVALSCESRGEVDGLVRTALEAGGQQAMEPIDHGFMYERSFYDPDGHHWAVLWMDPKAAQGQHGGA
ncbi:VOC family protein [Anaeromyxobacter oryzae]|uniref:Extradiol dioxygenase n=1 Tax=Anaeromyxobacter oryzae TaxID=2918170 RepID=A0ABN6MW05_9BACT|nr:VOC family protein [Anaeromyxobacter oryzae]BDG05149.1 extradiol dioxygenase [Anaeromyxobacter oryzae]